MKLIKLLVLVLVSCLAGMNSFAQDRSVCNILKHGKFKYLDAEDTSAYIVMNLDKQVEYSGKNNYTIESNIEWTNPCSYNMTMIKITIPNFPFKPGDIMKVDINNIEGDIIY